MPLFASDTQHTPFQYSDLENDMARGFVRLYQAPSGQPESRSNYFPVPDANAQIPALSVMQHIDALPEMWKSVYDVHRISRVIQDLEDVARFRGCRHR